MTKSSRGKQETKARLLAAAASEFGRIGLERANIDAISVVAGYAKGTIYNYFASKEDLFLAVVQSASKEAAARSLTPQDAPARARLRASLEGFCSWARDEDALARVFVRECLMGTPGLYSQVIQAEAPLVEQLEAIVVEGVDREELRRDVPPRDLAHCIAGLTDLALVQHWASGGVRPSIEDIPDLVLTLLLGPLSASKEPK
jgi:TetR/AcrR family transcriptional regulator, cholesterol catabolism regulator